MYFYASRNTKAFVRVVSFLQQRGSLNLLDGYHSRLLPCLVVVPSICGMQHFDFLIFLVVHRLDCTYRRVVVLTFRLSAWFACHAWRIHANFACVQRAPLLFGCDCCTFAIVRVRSHARTSLSHPSFSSLLFSLAWMVRTPWSTSHVHPHFSIVMAVVLRLVHWVWMGMPGSCHPSTCSWFGLDGGVDGCGEHTVPLVSAIRSTTSPKEKENAGVGSSGRARRWRWRRRRTRCRRRTNSASAWCVWKRNTRTCKPAKRCTSSRAGACGKTRTREQAFEWRRSTSVAKLGRGGKGFWERGVVG